MVTLQDDGFGQKGSGMPNISIAKEVIEPVQQSKQLHRV
jgi:hypothetical protein